MDAVMFLFACLLWAAVVAGCCYIVYAGCSNMLTAYRARRFVADLRHAPPAPQGVRVIRPNGARVPLDLAYTGRDTDGMYRWEPVRPVDVGPDDLVVYDVLPAGTRVVFKETA